MKTDLTRLGRFVLLSFAALALTLLGCGEDKGDGGKKKGKDKEGKAASEFDASKATASVRGKVVYKGEASAPRKFQMTGDAHCEKAHGGEPVVQEDDAVVVNEDGTLQNVLVYVESEELAGFSYPDQESQPVVLDQKGCEYVPHTFGIMVGQPLDIRNSDDTMHNIHFFSDLNEPFNETQQKGQQIEKAFAQEEIGGRFKCDKHSWMGAWVMILPHPFHGSTGDAGTFELPKLPPGKYTLVAWHEKLKEVGRQEIEIKEGENTVDFEVTK